MPRLDWSSSGDIRRTGLFLAPNNRQMIWKNQCGSWWLPDSRSWCVPSYLVPSVFLSGLWTVLRNSQLSHLIFSAIYRVVELAGGFHGRVISTQVYFSMSFFPHYRFISNFSLARCSWRHDDYFCNLDYEFRTSWSVLVSPSSWTNPPRWVIHSGMPHKGTA